MTRGKKYVEWGDDYNSSEEIKSWNSDKMGAGFLSSAALAPSTVWPSSAGWSLSVCVSWGLLSLCSLFDTKLF